MVQGSVFVERNHFHKMVYSILFTLSTNDSYDTHSQYYIDDQKLTKFEFFIFVLSVELHPIDLEI